MQLELMLGFVLIVYCTNVYNRIVLLYNQYLLLYNKIKSAIAHSGESTSIVVHNGADIVNCYDYIGSALLSSHMVGFYNKEAYWLDTSGGYGDNTVYCNSTTYDISIANMFCEGIQKISTGWMATYYPAIGTSHLQIVLYDNTFTLSDSLSVPSSGSELQSAIYYPIGYDGTYAYLGRFQNTVMKVDFVSGSYSYIDSVHGFIWGSGFYKIVGNFLITPENKKFLLKELGYFSVNETSVWGTSVWGTSLGSIFLNAHFINPRNDKSYLYFDGTYLYIKMFSIPDSNLSYLVKQINTI